MSQIPTEPENELLVVRPGKWTLVVISELRDGSRRFNQLRRMMGGISQKTLTVTLRELERDGFISRRAYATIPPRVEYALTGLGEELLALADGWRLFARTHRHAVLEARSRYDSAQDEGYFLIDESD